MWPISFADVCAARERMRPYLAPTALRAYPALDQARDVDAMVIAVGGGSQAVGAMTVAGELAPELRVYGVQAASAAAIHDSWHAGAPLSSDSADTIADGLATRSTYELTFAALQAGLSGFVAASEAQIAAAVRLLLSTTHNLAEGAGAAGLAGLALLADELAGQTVAIILSGANIDASTLARIYWRAQAEQRKPPTQKP